MISLYRVMNCKPVSAPLVFRLLELFLINSRFYATSDPSRVTKMLKFASPKS